ncbi:hypothetical protein ACOMHN_008963 [Nucella lapillus]
MTRFTRSRSLGGRQTPKKPREEAEDKQESGQSPCPKKTQPMRQGLQTVEPNDDHKHLKQETESQNHENGACNCKTNPRTLRDGLHPTARGASVLAVNIGRYVRQLFWERPKKTRRLPRPTHQIPMNYSASSYPQHPALARGPWYNTYGFLRDWF